jgi:outer membrane protein TolC
MSCKSLQSIALLLGFSFLLTGCYPSQPMYLRDSGDLSYYLNQATEIEYPDVQTSRLLEVEQSRNPITVINADFDNFYDMSLEDCVGIALQNTKTIRGYGTPGLSGTRVNPGVDNLSNGPNGAGTLWNVAIRESEPGFIGTPGQISAPGAITTNTGLDGNQGVEAALADFDAQFTSSLTYAKTDEPRNVVPNFSSFEDFQQDQVTFQSEVLKKTANGTQLFFRNVNSYTDNNVPLVTDTPQGFQVLSHSFRSALEAEIRQPLLRGRGAFIQRMPIVISRIGTDQEIANLEAQVQNLVTNVEIRYWELHCAYRNFEASKAGQEAALVTWRIVSDQFREGADVNIQQVAQAGEQFHFFDEQVIDAFNTLLAADRNLRWLLGFASTDGQLLRPTDEPVMAPVEFDWHGCKSEALCYRPELRQTRWEVKKRELAVSYSKNGLLPELNVTGLYRWLGLGDDLVDYSGGTPDFPAEDSASFNQLFGGNFQELAISGEFRMPVGFRRGLANVRNAQLKLSRERSRLEDQELDVVRELEDAIAALDANRVKMQKSFNRWGKTKIEKDHFDELRDAGVETLDVALDAQRRQAQAKISFYTSLCEYNKMIALIHRRKGTILAYNGVCFAEGPWTDKAYHDATQHARRRGASRELNYGWTRPEVISRGGIWPQGGSTPVSSTAPVPVQGTIMDPIQQDLMAPGMIQGEMLPESVIESPITEPLPMPQIEGSSTRIIRDHNIRRTNYTEPATRQPRRSPPALTSSPERKRQVTLPKRDPATEVRTARRDPANLTQTVSPPAPAKPQPQKTLQQPAQVNPTARTMNWDRLGLTPPQQSMGPNRATIKPVK